MEQMLDGEEDLYKQCNWVKCYLLADADFLWVKDWVIDERVALGKAQQNLGTKQKKFTPQKLKYVRHKSLIET